MTTASSRCASPCALCPRTGDHRDGPVRRCNRVAGRGPGDTGPAYTRCRLGRLALAAYAAAFLYLVRAAQHPGLGLAHWRFGSWVLFWYAAAFGVATMSWSQPQSGASAQIAISSVLRALWLVAVGLTAWVLGYFVGPGWPAERSAVRGMKALSRRFLGEVRGPATPWILYAIGVVARVLSTTTTSRFGYVGNVTSVVSTDRL